jgi:transcriptional regulator with XRE-family HTH domain
MDLGLGQTEAGRELGVCRATLANWEWGRAQPPVGRMPAVIRFLGYDPHPDPMTVGETLRAYRRALGLTQRELGVQLGMHRSVLGKVEIGAERPSESSSSSGLYWTRPAPSVSEVERVGFRNLHATS